MVTFPYLIFLRMVMSARTFRVLTRILCCDAYFSRSGFNWNIDFIQKPRLYGISRCFCADMNLENQTPQPAKLPAAIPEKLPEKTISKSKDIQLNIEDFVDSYPVLQSLVDLGVEIYKFNHDQSLCKFLMKIDFDNDIKPYLVFLYKNGVPRERLAEFLTINPYILQADFDDLHVRINYLESKNFTKEMISHIITENPKWLSYNVKDVDSRLGEVQQALEMSGNQMRSLVTSFPGIVSVKKEYLRLNMFTFKEEFGITLKECQSLILKQPRLLRINNRDLIYTLDYLMYNMGIQMHLIIEQPRVLKVRPHKIKQRHLFLQCLGRAQYNPKLPGYVSLTDLITTDDEEFCQRIAKSTLETFYSFQKTM